MSALALRAMDAVQAAAYRTAVLKGFVAQQVEFGGFTEAEALERGRTSMDRLWPGEAVPAGHHVWNAEDDGVVVGRLWLAERTPEGPEGKAWVFDIEIDEATRGRGLGRALMRAALERAREFGCTTVGLNVFGGNAVAIGLYESLGFRVQAQQMRLEL